MLDQPVDLGYVCRDLGIVVTLVILVEGGEQAHDLLLANLHGAADAVVLLLHVLDDVSATGDEAGRGGLKRLGAGVADHIGSQGDVLAEVLLGRAVHHKGQAVRMRNVPHGLDADHALLHAVVALDVEQRDGLLVDGLLDVLGVHLIGLTDLNRHAAAQANHRGDGCAEVD